MTAAEGSTAGLVDVAAGGSVTGGVVENGSDIQISF
jgi:hypothetical protein